MMCKYPIKAIRKQNKLIILNIDEIKKDCQTTFARAAVFLPCRQCLMCRWEQYHDWSLRCKLEAKRYNSNLFVTLTYEESPIIVKKSELQRFMKNLRTHFERHLGLTGIRFFGCGEYGKENLRPHYHIIIFNCPRFGDEKFYKKDKAGYPLYKSETIERLWGKGFCTIGGVSDKSIEYVTRTFIKSYYIKPPNKNAPAFVSMSKQGGIGMQYLTEHFDEIIENGFIEYDGRLYRIPYAYNRKIEEKIGTEAYTEKVVIPRKEQEEAFRKMLGEGGQPPTDVPTDIIEEPEAIEQRISKLIAHDEETPI